MAELGNHLEHGTSYYEHISPTAYVIAYERTFTDIPFSKDIFDLIEQSEGGEQTTERSRDLSGLAPRYEARFKLVNKLLEETGNSDVIEIAPGLSPRGIIYSSTGRTTSYVELDLPHMSEIKGKVIDAVINLHNLNIQEKLSRSPGNALEGADIDRAVSCLDDETPVTFICEGLMRYFDFDEKRKLATNILDVLRVKGGVWITPDITLKSFTGGFMGAIGQRVGDISGIDLSSNYFENIEHATEFFEGIGFGVTSRSFLEMKDSLTSGAVLGLGNVALSNMLETSTAFVLEP